MPICVCMCLCVVQLVGTPYYLSPELCQNKRYNERVSGPRQQARLSIR